MGLGTLPVGTTILIFEYERMVAESSLMFVALSKKRSVRLIVVWEQ
jgi:hypothetical protein